MDTNGLVSENRPKCQNDTNPSKVETFEIMGYLIKWDMGTYLRKFFDGTPQDGRLQDSITVLGQVNQLG